MMKPKEIIKEIDPDYHRCMWCGQLFHVDDMIISRLKSPEETITIYTCKDEKCKEEHKI